MVVLNAEPYSVVRTHTGPLRARTWLVRLCPVWNPIGNPQEPVRLSKSLLWSQNSTKPVSESCASSTFRYGYYGAHTGLTIFENACGLARHVVELSSFDPYGARELLESFMWPRHLGDFIRTSQGPYTTPKSARARCFIDRGILGISYGLTTGHRVVRHPNLHGHETIRTSHLTVYYLFSLFPSDVCI